MRHFAGPSFWSAFGTLPVAIRKRADAAFERLKANPSHPSLHFKKAGGYWSVRVTDNYRALGVEDEGNMVWFWIGSHAEYDKLLK